MTPLKRQSSSEKNLFHTDLERMSEDWLVLFKTCLGCGFPASDVSVIQLKKLL